MNGLPRRARLYGSILGADPGVDHDSGRTKPRVAFCHGLFGQGKNWTSIAKQLTDDYIVALIDMPDHGRSPWTAEVSYPHSADLVAEYLLDSSDGEPWTVVGHSMGGKIAMMLALRHPDLVQSLCVVDIAPVDYTGGSEFVPYVQGMRSVDLGTLRSRAEADQQLRATVPAQSVRSFLLQNLRRGSDDDQTGWHWQMNLQLLGDQLATLGGWPDPHAEPYPGPTLWVGGADSNYIRPEYAPAMRGLFPQLRTVKIKNARHWVHSDQPEVFTAVLKDFLSRTAAVA
ncbi:alpha/beta fold hydrolase [Microlunatus soli]|uniref:Pimeloyl-ACP methyl ester carboxylesterase n=1 Tax=Microlunatus soli TaxID=630515 RepID=A0A1H1ZW85_9ACTN|nr:alpha/beta fold hydrolase [Microlunatus soli]SDT37984.1 Pimeloyl-ACP methyl ester carboxylesterase [Microlunatus soli]